MKVSKPDDAILTFPSGGGPREIVVLGWTDAWGQCFDTAADAERLPDGLGTIYAREGDVLVFKYSMLHDVWRVPDAWSFDNCIAQGSGWELYGNSEAGGGCPDDSSYVTRTHTAAAAALLLEERRLSSLPASLLHCFYYCYSFCYS